MAEQSTEKTTEKSAETFATPSPLTPRATEKTYLAQAQRTYAFFVDPSASKQEIAKKVSESFNVTVTSVRTLIRKGKKCRFSKGKHAYPGTSFRRDHKLAYVTLKEGNSIRVFEESETASKSEKQGSKAELSAEQTSAKKVTKVSAKADKSDKKSAKNADKEKE